jgi:hypothetical protein
MICFDDGRVASGDFYGDVQLTRIHRTLPQGNKN